MVLRPGAWESSAPPVFFSKAPCLVQDEAGGLFLFRTGRRPRVSMPRDFIAARLHAARFNAVCFHAAHLHATDFLKKHHVALN